MLVCSRKLSGSDAALHYLPCEYLGLLERTCLSLLGLIVYWASLMRVTLRF